MVCKLLLPIDKQIQKSKKTEAYKFLKKNPNSSIASNSKLKLNNYYNIYPNANINIAENKDTFFVSKTDFNICKVKLKNNIVILKDISIGDNVIISAARLIYKKVLVNSVIVNKQEQMRKFI